jgi:hypothetical protein
VPIFRSGVVHSQEDRDDPEGPLVTEPFGHASQEIVNLFLCHKAVANVFDGNIDLGEGMQLKGIPTPVQVGLKPITPQTLINLTNNPSNPIKK